MKGKPGLKTDLRFSTATWPAATCAICAWSIPTAGEWARAMTQRD